MDNNEYEAIERSNALFNERILTALIDTILVNTSLSYSGKELHITSDGDEALILFIKTFYYDEYVNRYEALIADKNKLKEEADNE